MYSWSFQLLKPKISPVSFSADMYNLPRGGGTPLFGLYGDMPLDRVWFFGLAVLNRVWYYEPRDFNPDCEQSFFS